MALESSCLLWCSSPSGTPFPGPEKRDDRQSASSRQPNPVPLTLPYIDRRLPSVEDESSPLNRSLPRRPPKSPVVCVPDPLPDVGRSFPLNPPMVVGTWYGYPHVGPVSSRPYDSSRRTTKTEHLSISRLHGLSTCYPSQTLSESVGGCGNATVMFRSLRV